jgi:broad specificity phosphatase PhoE
LSVLYLVRHGQAGTRENYDSLSDLGRRQARLLGEHFAAQNLRFESAYSGSLARQRATAEEVRDAICGMMPGTMTGAMPEITVDRGWDEFDLAHVYTEMAPYLSAADADFRREYEEMQSAVTASQGAHDAPVHRRWNDCDKKVVRAWVEGRHEYSGESWQVFGERVRGALARILETVQEGNVVVFTSATPIGVCAGQALEIQDGRIMALAGVLLNASFSTLRLRSPEIRLFSFNAIPHLDDASLRTFR